MNALVFVIGLATILVGECRNGMKHPIYGNGYNEKVTKIISITGCVLTFIGLIIIGATS